MRMDAVDGRLMKTRILLGLVPALVAVLVTFPGCRPATRIGDIQSRPSEFDGKVVTVSGEASGVLKLPFVDQGLYEVQDGTGKITVLTKGPLPASGQTIRVTGRVRSAFQVMGRSFGLVINEETP